MQKENVNEELESDVAPSIIAESSNELVDNTENISETNNTTDNTLNVVTKNIDLCSAGGNEENENSISKLNHGKKDLVLDKIDENLNLGMYLKFHENLERFNKKL